MNRGHPKERVTHRPIISTRKPDAISSGSQVRHASAARHLSLSLGIALGHYRSRYESLISYSNHAFSERRLLTVADRRLPHAAQPELVRRGTVATKVSIDALLALVISFHFYLDAVYERRGNKAEAETIAHLVRKLLVRDIGLSGAFMST